jgi:hypothetical protein
MERFGIISYMKENWKLFGNVPLISNQAQFARILAKIMGYSDYSQIKRILNKMEISDHLSDSPYRTDKAVQAIDLLLQELKIEPLTK